MSHKNVPFLVNERDFTSRVRAAQEYIKCHARVSVEHDKGAGTLHAVAAHLVAYLQLDPAFACLPAHEATEGRPKLE